MSGTGLLLSYEGGMCRRYLRGETPLSLSNVRLTDLSSSIPLGSGFLHPQSGAVFGLEAAIAAKSTASIDDDAFISVVRVEFRSLDRGCMQLYISEVVQACSNVTCDLLFLWLDCCSMISSVMLMYGPPC